ncbi:unnamed protein product [Chrysodeixis includens]|uniref:Ig-like domain-containing protein n=1 Tax=Chrysodeixis includens TaxID=689277 RepID=A0A9N8PZW6_CHRIL|nr:unnamed protein product [Chrysodeixis includens]
MSASSTPPLRAACLLLCFAAGSLQFSIKEFAVPNKVEVGNAAELICQYELGEGETEADLYVKWWWTPDSSSSDDRKQIYQRIAGQAAESIHRSNASKIEIRDNDTIVLLDVNPVDSGTYECEVNNIDEIRKHDKLIVFTMGTGPEVNYTLIEDDDSSADDDDDDDDDDDEDQLFIECSAEGVAPLPDMSISVQGNKVNLSKTVEDVNQDGFYTISANTTVSASNTEISEIRCEMFYASLEHPPYEDVETYTPAGALPLTTEVPEDASEPETTPESLENPSDDGVRVHSSWVLMLAALVSTLRATL